VKVQPDYLPRFVSWDQAIKLVNLYHIARTALAGGDAGRHARMLWACSEFHKSHPEISQTAAYKDLCGMLA
jgi:hypothetical protein